MQAAAALADRLNIAGIANAIVSPLHGDDFNDDLRRGATAADYQRPEPVQLSTATALATVPEFEAAAQALTNPPDLADARQPARAARQGPAGALARAPGAGGDQERHRHRRLHPGKADRRTAPAAERDRRHPPRANPPALGEPAASRPRRHARAQRGQRHHRALQRRGVRRSAGVRRVPPGSPGQPAAALGRTAAHCTRAHGAMPTMCAAPNGCSGARSMSRRSSVSRSVGAVARDIRIHPVRDYLNGLRWDGVPRLETWAITYLGAEDTPLNRAFGSRWMISAVARIMQPGVKADHMLILEGPQGGEEVERAQDARRRRSGSPTSSPRSAARTPPSRCAESGSSRFAELDAISRAEVSRIKAFLTRTTDRYRPPYERYVVDGAAPVRVRRQRQSGHLSARRDRQPPLLAGAVRRHRSRRARPRSRPAVGRSGRRAIATAPSGGSTNRS